ncbi:MAG: CAP domain-containing protein [Mobilitalea sp.]
MADEVLGVRGTSISLNEGIDRVICKLGSPHRIVDTEYNFDYYIYNNDYSRLLFVAVKDGFVVGYYTDSLDFNFKGIRFGADIRKVEKALGNTFSMAEALTQTNDYYTVKILMDKLVSQKVTGIYLLSNNIKQEVFTDVVLRDVELMIYDLTNSVRVRNNESILSWSSSAALSARKHSLNMSRNNFFNHLDPEKRSPGDRLKAEGISYRTYGENIIAGYGTAILSNHAWFNSSGHRNNMLNSNFRYLGVGFTYDLESTYNTYITQNFYR